MAADKNEMNPALNAYENNIQVGDILVPEIVFKHLGFHDIIGNQSPRSGVRNAIAMIYSFYRSPQEHPKEVKESAEIRQKTIQTIQTDPNLKKMFDEVYFNSKDDFWRIEAYLHWKLSFKQASSPNFTKKDFEIIKNKNIKMRNSIINNFDAFLTFGCHKRDWIFNFNNNIADILDLTEDAVLSRLRGIPESIVRILRPEFLRYVDNNSFAFRLEKFYIAAIRNAQASLNEGRLYPEYTVSPEARKKGDAIALQHIEVWRHLIMTTESNEIDRVMKNVLNPGFLCFSSKGQAVLAAAATAIVVVTVASNPSAVPSAVCRFLKKFLS